MTDALIRRRPDGDPALLERRRDAVARLTHALRVAEEAASARSASREMRLDADRRLDVLKRQQQALLARAEACLAQSDGLLLDRPRVVLAHSKAWFSRSLAALLEDRALDVVGQVDNGAEAVGLVAAEQPDLVLVEERLAMLPGEDVVRALREYCPQTLVVAQASSSARVGVLLEAGAQTVLGGQVRPDEAADRLLGLLEA